MGAVWTAQTSDATSSEFDMDASPKQIQFVGDLKANGVLQCQRSTRTSQWVVVREWKADNTGDGTLAVDELLYGEVVSPNNNKVRFVVTGITGVSGATVTGDFGGNY